MGPEMPLYMVLSYAFLGGVILNAMPCVFPMLGIKLMSVVKKSGATTKTVRLSGILYTLGVVMSFLVFAAVIAVLKASGKQVGWGFQLQSPVFIAALASLFVLITLNFFGMFEVYVPSWLIPQKMQQKDGLSGEFFAGVMVALVASPCTAPFMASALGYALSQPVPVMMLTFMFLGLGLGAPFLLLTFFPRFANYLPKPGAWMITLRQLLGFPLLLTVAWLVWVFAKQTDIDRAVALLCGLIGLAFFVWVRQKVRRLGILSVVILTVLALMPMGYAYYEALDKPPKKIVQNDATSGEQLVEKHGVKWHVFTPEKASELTEMGKTVFVDFTAAWCITCQANAKAVFGSQKVLDTINNRGDVALIIADWTDEDEQIALALESFGRSGVPLYLVYKPEQEVKILPQILTPDIFLEGLGIN